MSEVCEFLSDSLEEKFIHVRTSCHLLLPFGPFVVLDFLQDVFEIVESEDSGTFVEYEKGEIVHLHVYLRCQSYPGSALSYGFVFNDEKFVLQSHVFVVGRWYFELTFLLHRLILVYGFGVEKQSSGIVDSVIADGVEVGLAIG